MASSVAWAGEYTVINHSNKASPATVFARAYTSSLDDALSVSFYQAQNCEQAKKKYNSTENALMVYNADVGIAAMSKGLECGVDDIEPANLVFQGSSYFKICRNPESKKDIRDGRVTFGMASVVLSKGIIDDYNSNGLNLVGVPYGGSKNVLAAVISGDLDYGFIGASIAQPAIDAGRVVCEYSTDPRDANYVANTLDLKIRDFKLWKSIYTNVTDEVVVAKMRAAAESDDFTAFLEKHGQTSQTKDFTDANVNDFRTWIEYNYNLYWK
jgi:hypothetical protein